MFAAEFEPVAPEQKRRSARAAVVLDADIDKAGLGRTLCKVVDLSMHGARLQTYSALRRGAAIRLTLPRVGPISAVVMWADDFAAGCQFRKALTPAQFDDLIALG